jgi:hypothetical protein
MTPPPTRCNATTHPSQGDEECKGCGRPLAQHWLSMSPVENESPAASPSRRTAWRFGRYADRALEQKK